MDREEIERQSKRARELGVDRLITRIYFDLGFRNFALMHASAVSPVFPSAKNVAEHERDRLDFTIDNRPYGIRVRERSYDRRDGLEVEVYRQGEVVFAAIIRRRRRRGRYRTEIVTAFSEGAWLRDFEQLQREATEHYVRRRKQAAQMAAVRDRRPWYRRLLRALGIS